MPVPRGSAGSPRPRGGPRSWTGAETGRRPRRPGGVTAARCERLGRVAAAEGGTLFLDEIGNLPLHLQPKLLTALERRAVVPVGANQPSRAANRPRRASQP